MGAFFFKRTRDDVAGEVARIVRETLPGGLDYTIESIAEFLGGRVKRGLRDPRTAESLIASLREALNRFTAPGQLYHALSLALKILESRGEANVDVPGVFEKFVELDRRSRLEAAAKAVEEVRNADRILIVGFSSILEDFITKTLTIGGVEVYVLEASPAKRGRLLVRAARRRRLKSYYAPDSAVYWLVEDSHSIVTSLYGFAREGIVVDAGSAAALALARELSVKTLVLGSELSVSPPASSIGDVASLLSLEAGMQGGGVKRRMSIVDLWRADMVDTLVIGRTVEVGEALQGDKYSEFAEALSASVRESIFRELLG
ncbi:hypothetical protein APE_0493.1 [Aeropyrum pernix K1]|uniref:Uncharacterized protein n=1 Tax=Aeropyrum pernix (strain ATCC 700893 / DSM 11879 / JCM 9820 / NBRC 100138 / K1) TaxID=272557 RepID=Q9YET8_AERPE|nr:hypothetical protein [Aeropyrum pernix]BAA79458.2 hypothetical protein APE_0493.1 [Aeropyrum pernix K1]